MLEFPALYKAASISSRSFQSKYFNSIRIEFLIIIIVSLLFSIQNNQNFIYIIILILLVISIFITAYRSFEAPDKNWYRNRALAESVKTSSWRYMMRAAPFDDANNLSIPRSNFSRRIKEILVGNEFNAEKIHPEFADGDLITQEMDNIRKLELANRIEFYKINRIKDQRTWYKKKSIINKNFALIFFWTVFSSYLLVFLFIGLKIYGYNSSVVQVDPILVFAASIVGWIQSKRYNELAASYLLTAHEIGIAAHKLEDIDSERAFSDFVNEIELAFSREHTQWIARQDTR